MALTKTDLDQFTATEHYWRHWTGKIVCTDGVTYLADRSQASWLVDAIRLEPDALRFASYQTRTFLKDQMLQQFQHWKLTVNADHTATLVCERDTDDVVVIQEIAYTDFALNEIRLYLVTGVLMLTSEY